MSRISIPPRAIAPMAIGLMTLCSSLPFGLTLRAEAQENPSNGRSDSALDPAPDPVPDPAALDPAQSCEQAIAQQLPDAIVQLRPDPAETAPSSPEPTLSFQWEADSSDSGLCRTTAAGVVVELTNWRSVPSGQRPIETVVAFSTGDYAVRVFRVVGQLYMNVYNQRTARPEIERIPAQAVTTDTGVIYTNLLGATAYRATIATDQSPQLVVQQGDIVVYDSAAPVTAPITESPSQPESASEAESTADSDSDSNSGTIDDWAERIRQELRGETTGNEPTTGE